MNYNIRSSSTLVLVCQAVNLDICSEHRIYVLRINTGGMIRSIRFSSLNLTAVEIISTLVSPPLSDFRGRRKWRKRDRLVSSLRIIKIIFRVQEKQLP
jgi:hypothetical protein